MRKPFKLDCIAFNTSHVKFIVFDWRGANCGTLTILTEDVKDFIKFDWSGELQWNGLVNPNFDL